MREIAAVSIVAGLVGFALASGISLAVFGVALVAFAAAGFTVWAWRTSPGRDPFGRRPRWSVAVDIAVTLNGLVPDDHPMRTVYKSIARHTRRAGAAAEAPRSRWRRARVWLSAHLSPEVKAWIRRVLARIPGGAR